MGVILDCRLKTVHTFCKSGVFLLTMHCEFDSSSSCHPLVGVYLTGSVICGILFWQMFVLFDGIHRELLKPGAKTSIFKIDQHFQMHTCRLLNNDISIILIVSASCINKVYSMLKISSLNCRLY